jgi:hypothetical protein
MGKRQSLANFMKIRNESGKTEFLEYEKQQTKKTEHTPSQKQALFVEFQAYVKQVLRATSPPSQTRSHAILVRSLRCGDLFQWLRLEHSLRPS